MLMLRVMTWISLRLGRSAGRLVLYGIAAYFLVANASARRASRDYLYRALALPTGARVAWRHVFRHFFSFASVIHDRVYLINDRFSLFDIRIHQEHLVAELTADHVLKPGYFYGDEFLVGLDLVLDGLETMLETDQRRGSQPPHSRAAPRR